MAGEADSGRAHNPLELVTTKINQGSNGLTTPSPSGGDKASI